MAQPTRNAPQGLTDVRRHLRHDWTENQDIVTFFGSGHLGMVDLFLQLKKAYMSPIRISCQVGNVEIS